MEMSMVDAHFKSSQQLRLFAKRFLRDQVKGFRKDIRICLTMDRQRRHAYFPALIRCISFADFLGGLHAGDIENHKFSDLWKYAKKFMNAGHYDELRLAILYEGFRHKIAHLSDPPRLRYRYQAKDIWRPSSPHCLDCLRRPARDPN